MPLESRWTAPIPRCSLQQWVFGSSRGPLPTTKLFIDPERPDTHFLSKADYRLLGKRVALGLRAQGIRPGDRVLVFSGNNLYFPSFFMGVLMAGAIFTGANPTYVSRELAYQLRDSGASLLLVAEASLDTALEAAREVGLPKSKIFVFGGDSPGAEVTHSATPKPGTSARRPDGVRHWTELLAGSLETAKTWDWTEPADPAATTCCLNYSSGTTGVPKGVEISHTSYVANGVGVTFVSELDPDHDAKLARSSGLGFLPLYHAFGQTYFIANNPRRNIPVYIMPSFDFVKMLTYVQRYRINSLTVVPPIVVALAKHPIVKNFDLSSLESIGCGAAPLGTETMEEVQKLFPPDTVLVRQGWGMTEITCTCLSWDPTRVDSRSSISGVGELMPNARARIMALDGVTEITTPKTPGEIWVTGPTLMKGYWHKPEATADTMVVDPDTGTRWLKTGDIGYVDEYRPGGTFHIVDRLKELIKVKGNQVAPAELEAVLLERPDVVDAAVVGVTIRGEELPRAYVVLAEGVKTTEREVADWMAGRVARHKQLRGGVVFTDVVPKNPSGKILRKILRDRAAKEVGDRKPGASKLA
ncbi:acetyl-CoA synthetase-like protein [Coniochaeta ligniaria NRRL 30616]|uniref:Acetyl-CoA synthetase-like protein n=1 Tax=Coniochaeta ligniaria NRRL 30616 TaxID=1408157 RepID=A0A1J7IWJ3_9PEZI|nr:acetyl-CoA synthetase-like protein [Coniochaeta ligniaria NRRL 30616]